MANDYGCFMEKMTLYLLMKTAIVISHSSNMNSQ